jgi:hypothetical protein
MKTHLTISVALAVFANFIEVDLLKASEQTPGIYIERIKDRSGVLVPGLKAQYNLCTGNRQIYRRLYEQGGAGWDAVKESLPHGYDVRAAAAPEPEWEKKKVGTHIEKEYFFGDEYARYEYRNRYEISEAERCALIRHEDLIMDIDNGRTRYLVTLKNKKLVNATPGVGHIPLGQQYETHKVNRMPSPLTLREKNDAALQDISKEERIARLLSLLFADTKSNRAPGVGLSYDKKLTENIKHAAGYEESNVSPVVIPRSNDEHFVAGQPCDIISAKNLRSRLWYWDRMHYYPGVLDRPILLKTEVTDRNGKVVGTEETIRFRVVPKIDHALFELDTSLR